MRRSQKVFVGVVGILVVLAMTAWFLIREPLPYAFLSKYPILERKVVSPDGDILFTLKGKFADVIRDAEAELGQDAFFLDGSSTSPAEFRLGSTDESMFFITNNEDSRDGGFHTTGRPLPDTCFVCCPRARTAFDRVKEWFDGRFGNKPGFERSVGRRF